MKHQASWNWLNYIYSKSNWTHDASTSLLKLSYPHQQVGLEEVLLREMRGWYSPEYWHITWKNLMVGRGNFLFGIVSFLGDMLIFLGLPLLKLEFWISCVLDPCPSQHLPPLDPLGFPHRKHLHLSKQALEDQHRKPPLNLRAEGRFWGGYQGEEISSPNPIGFMGIIFLLSFGWNVYGEHK